MRKTIENLWNGNLNLCAFLKEESKYNETLERFSMAKNKLEQFIPKGEAWKLIDNLDNTHNDVVNMEKDEAFIIGFRIGVRLIIESLTDNDGIFIDNY